MAVSVVLTVLSFLIPFFSGLLVDTAVNALRAREHGARYQGWREQARHAGVQPCLEAFGPRFHRIWIVGAKREQDEDHWGQVLATQKRVVSRGQVRKWTSWASWALFWSWWAC